MAVSAAQTATSGLFAQIQQLQAQRNADQAEQRARILLEKARQAQTVADRAQESARSLKVESNQAQSDAGRARQGLAARESISQLQSGFANLREQVASVTSPVETPAAVVSAAPVVNAFGQETGTLVNVTA